jgi:CheY-like chemotaxis protein
MIAVNRMADVNASTVTAVKTAPKSFRILVVDDNHDSALSLAMMLSIMGHETRTAHDGESAVSHAESFLPEVVLLDIGLPLLNGYEVAQRIREQPWGKSMFLIAVTGWGQEEDRQRSSEVGLNVHMVKPVEPAALEKLLAELPQDGPLQEHN